MTSYPQITLRLTSTYTKHLSKPGGRVNKRTDLLVNSNLLKLRLLRNTLQRLPVSADCLMIGWNGFQGETNSCREE